MGMRWCAADGEPLAIVAEPGDADLVAEFAAAELQRYLGKMTGRYVPVVTEPSSGSKEIRIQQTRSGDGLPPDAFTIRVDPTAVHIEATTSRGVLYAAYRFLEMLGCRWVHPGEAEEIVPVIRSVDLPDGTTVEKPLIEHRGLALYGLYGATVEMGRRIIDWMGKSRLNLLLTSWDRPDPTDTQTMKWPEVADALLPELRRRGMLLEMSEHATHYFMPRSMFEEHPDWFALVGGARRPGQVCYSNAAAVEYMCHRRN